MEHAAEMKWCVKPRCTTCGAQKFRGALRNLGGPLGGPVCDALCELSPVELVRLPRWDEALETAILDLRVEGQVEAVLGAWLPHVGRTPRFDDVVLFRFVRFLGTTSPIRESWIKAAIPPAVAMKDHSLVESLLFVLGPDVIRFPKLATVATELAISSKQMRRVLANRCGIRLT